MYSNGEPTEVVKVVGDPEAGKEGSTDTTSPDRTLDAVLIGHLGNIA